MKQFIFLLSLMFSYPLFSQEWNIGARWLYFQSDYMPDETDEYVLFEVSSDTLIENTLEIEIKNLIVSEFYTIYFMV